MLHIYLFMLPPTRRCWKRNTTRQSLKRQHKSRSDDKERWCVWNIGCGWSGQRRNNLDVSRYLFPTISIFYFFLLASVFSSSLTTRVWIRKKRRESEWISTLAWPHWIFRRLLSRFERAMWWNVDINHKSISLINSFVTYTAHNERRNNLFFNSLWVQLQRH